MLSCLRYVLRALPVLGCVVLFAALAGVGVAQDAPRGAAFPWLSPDLEQSLMLANSFAFQMQLFLGVSGGGEGGGLAAVRILAMMAVLVGAMMIVFFPKYQKLPTIATWLLLVVIVIFLPVGSQILFYPLKADRTDMIGYNERAMPDQDGETSCLQKPQGCGFTPQLLAVHIGSVLQTITSDIFRSKAWAGLIERQTAATELYTRKDEFDLGSGWIGANVKYHQMGCQRDITDILSKKISEADKKIDTMNFMDAFKGLQPFFQKNTDVFGSVPYLIILPKTETDAKKLWGDGDDVKVAIMQYEAGMTQLCDNLCVENKGKRVSLTGTATGSVSVARAIEEMQANHFFDTKIDNTWTDRFFSYSERPTVGVGVFMSPMENTYSKDLLATRRCFRHGTERFDALIYESVTPASNHCVRVSAGGNKGDPQHITNTYNFIKQRYLEGGQEPRGDIGNSWSQLSRMLMSSSDQRLKNMPVGTISFKANQRDGDGEYPLPTAMEPEGGLSCSVLGESIVEQVIGSLTANHKPKTFDKLVAILNGSEKDVFKTVPSKRQFKISDMTSETELQDSDPERYKLISLMAVRMNEALRMIDKRKIDGDETLVMRAAMVHSLVELMARVTTQATGLNYGIGANAAIDGKRVEPRLTGIDIVTDVGGDMGFNLGKILAKVAAWFTGPLAAAFIQFLSVLVNFTLMILVTITPLLFLFGLLIPSAAAGVLTIAVMAVLILKFVPITLIILNGIGGMVYDLLPYSVGLHAGFTRDLLVLAMGGLYLNIVGLTFFLMFKMGDPAAFLGRLTALDGTAKQLADRGITAAKAVAGLAATAAFGMVAGGVGAGMLKARARKLGNAMGIPDELMDVAGSAGRLSKQVGMDKSAETTTGGKDGASGGRTLPRGMTEEQYDALTDEQKALLADKNMGWYTDMAKSHGLTPAEVNQMVANGYIDKNGKRFSHTMNDKGSWGIGVSESPGELSGPLDTGRSDEEEEMFRRIEDGERAPVAMDIATRKPQTAEEAKAAENATLDKLTTPDAKGAGAAGGAAGTTTVSGGNVTTTGGMPAQVTVVGGKLDGVGQIERMASVQGASVQDRVAQRETEQVADKAAELRNSIRNATDGDEDLQKELAATMDRASAATSPEELKAIEQEANEILAKKGTSLRAGDAKAQELINMNQQLGQKLTDIERMPEFGKIQEKKAANIPLSAQEKKLQEVYDKLSKSDTAALTQADLAKRLANTELLQQALQARGRADNAPGILQSAGSGLYGAFAGAGGGLAKIPVIGPAISEAFNEYYQAPERARAWNAVGGYANWKEKQRDASRMGFYQKEMSPLASAAQYESMVSRGGFQAQYEIAAQAAREAVEKSRAQFEAMNASRKDMLSPVLTQVVENDKGFMRGLSDLSEGERREKVAVEVGRRYNEMLQGSTKIVGEMKMHLEQQVRNSAEFQQLGVNVPERMNMLTSGVNARLDALGIGADGMLRVSMNANELLGIGRIDAADRVASVRHEAFMMQGPSLVVQAAKYGLDGNMLLKEKDGVLQTETEDVSLVLTPELLQKFRGDLAAGRQSKNVEAMMTDHYSLAEKQYLRGDAEWNATRDMNRSKAASALFARKNVGTDYIIGAQVNMVLGKERFSETRGQYETLLTMRNQNNQKIAAEAQKMLTQAGNSMDKALASAGVDLGKFVGMSIEQRAVNMRSALEKEAAKALVKRNEDLPMDFINEGAMARGRSSFKLKSLKGRTEMALEADKMAAELEKSRASYMESLIKGMDARLTKGVEIDNNGETFRIKSFTKNIAGAADNVAKENAELLIKHFADVSNKMKEGGKRFADMLRKSEGKNSDERITEGANFITEEGWNTAYEMADARLKGYMDNMLKDMRQRVGEGQYVAADARKGNKVLAAFYKNSKTGQLSEHNPD